MFIRFPRNHSTQAGFSSSWDFIAILDVDIASDVVTAESGRLYMSVRNILLLIPLLYYPSIPLVVPVLLCGF